MDHRISWDLMGLVPKGKILSYPNFTFPLFFDLILCSFILISFRLCDASAFILLPYSVTHNLCHSILHFPSLVHLPSSVTLSLCHPHSHSLPSITLSSLLSVSLSSNSLPPYSDFVYLTFCPLWLCESFSTFPIWPCLPYYSEPCSI